MSALLEYAKSAFAEHILDAHSFRGDDTILIRRDSLPEVARRLKEDPEFDFQVLLDISVVDYLHDEERFEVVYHFLSVRKNQRIRLKTRVREEDAEVPSLVELWPGANWLEREAWDMFGVRFKGHPDLKRILMYEEFEGHPLRKDYPYDKRQPLIGPKN
jgi:NADH-quinone oxidoreductase subunit C